MDRNPSRPIVFRSRAASMLGALALLVAAAPDRARLIVDPSAFADEACLAPAFDGDTCSYTAVVEPSGRTGPSASAALLDPRNSPEPLRATPRAMRLEPDLSGLLDFGPEVVHRAPLRRNESVLPLRIAGSEKVATCLASTRHRPDRSQCARSARLRRR